MKRLLGKLLDNTLVSLLTMVIVALFIVFPFSFSIFNTSQNLREQYSLLDAFYTISNLVSSKMPYVKTQSDIIIVDLSDVTDRPGLFETLKRIMIADPKIVGFDVWMEKRLGLPVEDSLKVLLNNNPLIISPCKLIGENGPKKASFNDVLVPFYAKTDTSRLAAVNIDLQGTSWNCRTFTPQLRCKEKKFDTFDVAISALLDPGAYEAVMRHPDTPHYIRFARDGYQHLSAAFILKDTTEISSQLLHDKIVLLGDLNEASDFYPTPLKPHMSGVEIHANILNTILTGAWPRVMGNTLAWVLAFLGVFLLLPFMRLLRKNEWSSIFIGICLALVIIILVYVSYWVFIRFNYYVNTFYLILGIGFMGLAETVYRKITKK